MIKTRGHERPPFPIEQRRPALVIVAGPSGSGKTTFNRALYSGRLPEPIRELVPAGIAMAPAVDIKYPTKTSSALRPIGLDLAPENGCILHYALNRLAKLGIRRIEDDATLLKFRDTTDDSITVVNIVVSGRVLARQYIRRVFNPPSTGRYANRNLFLVRASKLFDLEKMVHAAKYRFGFAERLYRDWDAVVASMCELEARQSNRHFRVIGVEAAPQPDGEPENFRLLYCRDYAGTVIAPS